MTRTAKWSTGTAVLVVLLFVAAWFLLISPKRSEAAELRDQTLAQQDMNRQLQQKIAQLETLAQDLPRQRARLKVIEQQLPPAPDLPSFVRSLDAAAKAAGVSLEELNPQVPVSREAASTAGGAAVTPGAAGATQAKAGAPYLQEIPFSIGVTGEFAGVVDFLNRIEDLRRPLVVTTVVVDARAEDGALSGISNGNLRLAKKIDVTLQGKTFLATPFPPAAAQGAAPVAQAPTTPGGG